MKQSILGDSFAVEGKSADHDLLPTKDLKY
jgi:hypothetical protein